MPVGKNAVRLATALESGTGADWNGGLVYSAYAGHEVMRAVTLDQIEPFQETANESHSANRHGR